jgi:hypothetical protein
VERAVNFIHVNCTNNEVPTDLTSDVMCTRTYLLSVFHVF